MCYVILGLIVFMLYKTLKLHSSILTIIIAKLCHRDTLSVDVSVASVTVKLSIWEIFAQSFLQPLYSLFIVLLLIVSSLYA